MGLFEKFIAFIKKENLFQPKDKLLLAVSGGVDSVVLCHLCKQAGYDFAIAHCNFQLRGEESERDEQFVGSLGEKYGVQVFIKRFDTATYANENKQSLQVSARNLRYRWFLELTVSEELDGGVTQTKDPTPGWHFTMNENKPRIFTLTAHHANDSVETLLMNFFKGTGIRGLQGILPRHELLPFLVRPLLFATKEQLLSYAIQHNLSFVEDSSNASNKYTRNYFRNQLIPDIKKVYPQAEDNLIDNLQRFREMEILYQQSIQHHKSKLLEKRGSEIHIPVLKLLKSIPLVSILYEIIRDFGFTSHQTDEVIDLLTSETGKYIESGSHQIIKNRKWLIIAPIQSEEAQHILIEEKDKKIVFKAGQLQIEKYDVEKIQLVTDSSIAMLDAADISFPLLLRKWKQGDYFYPLGMKKKKKINRFLTDQKLSLTQKENTWVLEMNKKITWIMGMRIDDRFKVTPSTKKIVKISYLPK